MNLIPLTPLSDNLFLDKNTGYIFTRDDIIEAKTEDKEFQFYLLATTLLSELSPFKALEALNTWRNEEVIRHGQELENLSQLYEGAKKIINSKLKTS